MGGCAVPDASRIKDKHAEKMILCGILHDGRELIGKLDAAGFDPKHFFYDVHQKAFDLFAYVAYGNTPYILSDSFAEIVRRASVKSYGWIGNSFAGRREVMDWLLDIWSVPMWLCDEPGKEGWRKGMYFWADPHSSETVFTFGALAAAAKVTHLAARRRAIYIANEVIRDAIDPAGSADDIDRRIDEEF